MAGRDICVETALLDDGDDSDDDDGQVYLEDLIGYAVEVVSRNAGTVRTPSSWQAHIPQDSRSVFRERLPRRGRARSMSRFRRVQDAPHSSCVCCEEVRALADGLLAVLRAWPFIVNVPHRMTAVNKSSIRFIKI